MTVIPVVIGALGTVPQGLVRELEELEIGAQAKPVQTKTVKIGQTTGRVLET